MTQSRTYAPVSQAQLDTLKNDLRAEGLPIGDGNSGSFAAPHGFSVVWSYGGALVVTLSGSAWKMPLAWHVVEGGIKAAGVPL